MTSKKFLVQKSINDLEHPPSSPDLAPNDFWLFSKIKSTLKGRLFQETEDNLKCEEGTENCTTTGVPKIFPSCPCA
jgi:hypothetical protein